MHREVVVRDPAVVRRNNSGEGRLNALRDSLAFVTAVIGLITTDPGVLARIEMDAHQQRVRIGETRSLMRRSLKGVLPEKILKRKSKGNPEEAISRAVAREWPRLESLFIDARVCAYGFIDRAALQSTVEAFRRCCGTHSPALIKTLVLEVWLRALERRGASVKQVAAVGKEQILRPAVVQARASSVS